MDYLCGKFGDCSFSRFGSIVRRNRQTDTLTQTDRQTDRQTDTDERFTPATLVSVSNRQYRYRTFQEYAIISNACDSPPG